MSNSETVPAKYVFLDIVDYSSKSRTIEGQTDIIGTLNQIVNQSLQDFEIKGENKLLIPTGDGICICLLDISRDYDIHIRIALKILELISEYNKSQIDLKRRFEVRIGINEDTDNLIIDVNGNRNIAGAGINEAQRIMDQGDANQIFVGRVVYDHLSQREKYLGKFRRFHVLIKHNLGLEVYQLVNTSIPYLNSKMSTSINLPKSFHQEKEKIPDKISKLFGYYLALLIKHKEFIEKKAGDAGKNIALFTFFFYLAKDMDEKSNLGKYEKVHISVLPTGSFDDQFSVFLNTHFDILLDYTSFIYTKYFRPYLGILTNEGKDFFVKDSSNLEVSKEGFERLKKDWPEIVSELKLQEISI